jgi:dihydrofolate synthase/folylpolyglutamate synthase
MNIGFIEFLNNKTLFYDKIDYEVINKAWEILRPYTQIPYVIHLVGTNGKGTTGRFIASFLKQQNKSVLHYTSPHIELFNERIWIDGNLIDDTILEKTHQFFISIFPQHIIKQLTYFEYTTLMAIYNASGFDYLVLEAGLGGEFDATNVLENNLSVIPSIGMDHMNFLGNTLEQIATTKLKSCDNSFIFGEGVPKELYFLKSTILKGKKEIKLNKDLKLSKTPHIPQYLQDNLQLALSVLEYLGLFSDDLELELISGRFEKFTDNITLDVGHNPLAALKIQEELQDKKINLIYNSYKDKNYKEVLEILKNNISILYILPCNDDRIEKTEILSNMCENLQIQVKLFDNEIKKDEEYLVFGSFKVVEEFKNRFKSNEK